MSTTEQNSSFGAGDTRVSVRDFALTMAGIGGGVVDDGISALERRFGADSTVSSPGGKDTPEVSLDTTERSVTESEAIQSLRGEDQSIDDIMLLSRDIDALRIESDGTNLILDKIREELHALSSAIPSPDDIVSKVREEVDIQTRAFMTTVNSNIAAQAARITALEEKVESLGSALVRATTSQKRRSKDGKGWQVQPPATQSVEEFATTKQEMPIVSLAPMPSAIAEIAPEAAGPSSSSISPGIVRTSAPEASGSATAQVGKGPQSTRERLIAMRAARSPK